MTKPGARALKIISLVIGFGLFILLIRQSGFEEILARVRSLKSGFFLLLALAGLRTIVRSYAWMRCMTEEERKTGFLNVWRARLIGDTAGNLTAAGPLVAEPVRIRALGTAQPLSSSVLSLSIETLTYSISSGLVIISGLALLLAHFSLSVEITVASKLGIFLVAAAVISIVIVIWRRWTVLFHSVRKASELAASARISPLSRLGAMLDKKLEQLHSMEIRLHDFYVSRTRDFFLVACCELLFHVLAFAETYLTLKMIGYQASMTATFALEATNRVISIVFAFIPARLGVDEAGSALLAEALGLGGAAGVALAIVRKARVLVWSAVGLALFAAPRAGGRRQEAGGS